MLISLKGALKYFLCLVMFSMNGFCQTLTTDQRNFGIFEYRDRKIGFGTGFVLQDKCCVITCWHVAHDSNWDFKPLGTKANLKLTFIKTFQEADISAFALDSCISERPLQLGQFNKVKPGDTIFYLGWQSNQSAIRIDRTIVLSTGIALSDGSIVRYLEFETAGRPGYSGGPVLDTEGRVIAIISEGWIKKSMSDSTEVSINRAYSTDTLITFFKNGSLPK